LFFLPFVVNKDFQLVAIITVILSDISPA